MNTLGYTIIHLSWADRFRVLLGRELSVNIRSSLTDSEIPENFQMETSVYVERFITPNGIGAETGEIT